MNRIALAFCLALLSSPLLAEEQLQLYHPNEQSKKFPVGSAEERRARMAQRAATPAYTRTFDLSGLPNYVPEEKPTGDLRLCGNNYIGDSPLGNWWKEAFEKFQPGIKISMDMRTAAIGISCIYFDLADIGIDHDPTFYDALAHLRLKGYEPTGYSAFTGSYNVIGWQNTLVVVVNKQNPIAGITMAQIDGVFGSVRDGGWKGTVWHPEYARGADKDLRSWGQLGLKGEWAKRKIAVFGFTNRYSTATEFSDRVLQSSDKWNGDIHTYGNFIKPDGKTYLETDQVVDQVKADKSAIGFLRFHDGVLKDVKVLPVAEKEGGPYIDYTIENVQSRAFPLWGDQGLWVSQKPGQKLDPKIREFIRFVLSRQGQELVQKDGKFLPLTAEVVAKELSKLPAR